MANNMYSKKKYKNTKKAPAQKEQKFRSQKAGRVISNVFAYITLICMSIVWLIPFVCVLLQSFRSYKVYGGMRSYVIPKAHEWALDNYTFLLNVEECGFLKWYANTVIIAAAVAVLQTIIILCVSFALSRMRFKGRELLMRFWLILGMFPGFLTMICLYFLLKQFGLTQQNAVPGLILISVASCGMGYYVCKGYFDTIPKSLDEAARIDGASRMRVFISMIVPLSKPIIIYQALLAFMAPWCDYIFASYVAFGDEKGYNVAVGLYRWLNVSDYQGYFTRFCAGGILVAVPVTILFMCLQKYYVEGVTGGAVKG